MAVKLLYQGIPQFVDSSGDPYASARLFFYAAGSSTKQATYSDSAGSTSNDNPITLNSAGYPAVSGNIVPIWGTSGLSYKIGLAAPGSDDPPASFIWTIDNVNGVNDTTVTLDEWVASGLTPTYVSGTSFTFAGDQTTIFTKGRRLKTTNSGGTIYSTITNSAYTTLTTITVENDSGTLDSGLSAVSYGLLSVTNPSMPVLKDTNFLISGSSDQTKRFKFEADNITTATTRTLTVQDKAATIAALEDSIWTWNCALSCAVGSSALTISIKTRAGNDPSAGDPVFIAFRNATVATGDYSVLSLTSATSLTISSDSTLGTVNSVPFRFWIVGFNDGGTFRLGAINCLSSAAGSGTGRNITSIYPLGGFGIASSTSEGGAGAADSAQVFYTGTGVASKAYTTLGYLTYESGLATAGAYASTPTRLQPYGPGITLPGHIIQVQRTDTGAVATGTTVTVADNSIPEKTEGDEYMTQAITPKSAANVLAIASMFIGSNDVASAYTMIAALFQDTTTNSIVASMTRSPATTNIVSLNIGALILSSTTSATTFKIRAGAAAAGTTTFNGASGGRILGGVMNSFLEVKEIMG